MGIRLAGIGIAEPGIGKVPGRQYTNKEIIVEHLLPHLDPSSFRPKQDSKTHSLQALIQLMFELAENRPEAKKHSQYIDNALYNFIFPYLYGLSNYVPSLKKEFDLGFEKAAKRFTRSMGVQVRGLYVNSSDKYPTNTLAVHAALDAINNAKKVLDTESYSFDPKKIDGLICVSNTPDNIFPVHGKKIAQELGVKAKYYANNQMACASMADAIRTAGQWFKETKDCNVVLIIAADVTSRIRQSESIKNNPLQNLIFGDGAAALVFIRVPGRGGVIVSNIQLDNDAPDFSHRYGYTGDSDERYEDLFKCGDHNDQKLKEFGEYESKVMAGLILRYLKTRGGKLEPNDKLILPEATSIVRSNGLQNLEDEIKKTIKLHTVDTAVPTHGITGSPATAIAWKQAIERGQIKPEDRVTFLNSAISGLNCFGTFDPNAEEIFRFYEDVDDQNSTKSEQTLSPFVECPNTGANSVGLNGKAKKELIIDRNLNTVLEEAGKLRERLKV